MEKNCILLILCSPGKLACSGVVSHKSKTLCSCDMRYDSNKANRFNILRYFLYNERLCRLSNGLLLTFGTLWGNH